MIQRLLAVSEEDVQQNISKTKEMVLDFRMKRSALSAVTAGGTVVKVEVQVDDKLNHMDVMYKKSQNWLYFYLSYLKSGSRMMSPAVTVKHSTAKYNARKQQHTELNIELKVRFHWLVKSIITRRKGEKC